MTGKDIILPAEPIRADDLLDRSRDKLRTIWLALQPGNLGWLDDAQLLAVTATLDDAIRDLDSVWEHLQYKIAEPSK